jgi:hypothetical protein
MPTPLAEEVWRFRLPIPEVGYVRMIVEAYDGLALVVTPDAQVGGVIEWHVAPGREAEAEELARVLERRVGMVRVG